MSNSADANAPSLACSALSYERVMPQVSGSLRMNFIAFGLGVPSISDIFGISKPNHLSRQNIHHQASPIGACMGSSSDSVEVLETALNAACSVCHGRIAHLTRVGRSRTPANTVSRPR